MGIVEKELSKFRVGDKECIIELNHNNVIHVHYGDLRLDLTPEEFKNFASTTEKSREKLQEIKNGAQE